MNDQLKMESGKSGGSVECLGMTFPSEDARRDHFLNLLADKLKDPAFRAQEGFPKGADEAILAMSDPPYYTACPNPWLAEFVTHYGRPYDPAEKYAREPMAIDVSVGKTDPIYRAHSYHTKVPHLAIVPSILHYTEPGDVVLDGFSGSGMTGVAAQWCGSAPAVYRHELEMQRRKAGTPAPKWGARRVVLNDLSPAATFIGANYNLPFNVDAFEKAGKQLLLALEKDFGWMYETLHSDGKTKGKIEYTVWSQIYTCPNCAGEINFLNEGLDEDTKRVIDDIICPHCGSSTTKRRMERLFASELDELSSETIETPKRSASLISYTVAGVRYTKSPDANDLEVLSRINSLPVPPSVPVEKIPVMHMTHERARMDYSGITYFHHFFLKRALVSLGLMWDHALSVSDKRVKAMMLFWIEQSIWSMSVMNKYEPIQFGRSDGNASQVGRFMKGVYYVASLHTECSPWYVNAGKHKRLVKAFSSFKSQSGQAMITTGSASSLQFHDGTIDYIFTDPPFGENIYYADLNAMIEAWHRVKTDAGPEAIIDRHKRKALLEYQGLMQRCFSEYYRVLKPGRWMTVAHISQVRR